MKTARKQVQEFLGAASEKEIFFTSCGSESANTAIKGKKIEIPGDFTLACEYVYEEDKKDFVEHYSEPNIKTIDAFELEPSTFRIFKIKR